MGWTLIFSSCGSMILAALVLAVTGKKYLRAAATKARCRCSPSYLAC